MAETSSESRQGKSLNRIKDVLKEIGRSTQYIPYDIVGGPVDLATMVMRPFGYNVDKPVGGSDWLIEQARRAGIADEPTGSLTETGTRIVGGMLSPMAAQKAGQAAFKTGEMVTGAANRAGDLAVQRITGNPNATSVGVLEEAGNMVPLNRIFIPAKDEQALAMAKYLEERGMRPEQIWQKTGIGRLPAGRDYVQEIPDNEAVLSFSELQPAKSRREIANDWLDRKGFIPEEKKGIWGVGSLDKLVPAEAQKNALAYADNIIQSGLHYEPRSLDRYMRHDQLKAVDPDLMSRTSIARESEDAPHRGMYRRSNELLTTGGGRSLFSKEDPEEEALSTAIHELQHAVQYRAGHGLGGNPEDAATQLKMARMADPSLSEEYGQAHQSWREAWRNKGHASTGEYLNQLKEYSQREGLRPRMIFGKQDWYAYGDDYRREAGKMPRKPGPDRDRWLQGAAQYMLDKNLEKAPWKAGLIEEFDKRTAKNAQARADRVIKKNEEMAQAFRNATEKYNQLRKFETQDNGKYELYKRLEGEAMARLAQTRLKLSDIERRANYPFHAQYEKTTYENNQPARKEIFNPYGLDVSPDELFAYRETK